MRNVRSAPRRRSENERFQKALLRLRVENEWTQDTLASSLGVSKRTLSSWECGYRLPPFKQRLHVVLSLRDEAPEHVLEVADALGVSANQAVAPFLQPFRDALRPPPPVVAAAAVRVEPPPPPAPPPRVPPDPALLRSAMDALVHDAADAMNVTANELRAALERAVAGCAERGATLEEMRAAVAVKATAKRAGRDQ